tara:strand:+ start:7022 stop:7552 length:531 start_codon:yes stop_codon:yes gene_type:complete
MTETNTLLKERKLSQEIDIQQFKDYFKKEYSLNIQILQATKSNYKLDLEVFSECTLNALHKNEPEYRYIKSLTHRSRLRKYLLYVQVMSYLAYENKHTKVSIGQFIDRNHATVINSIRQVENYLFVNDDLTIGIFNNITKEIQNHVGTLSKNIKKQIDSKPSFSYVWNQTKNSTTL